MKRPSFQFYPGDWLRDTALRSCSLEARGLWFEMLCWMHEGSPYGYLKVNLKVITLDTLARMVGGRGECIEKWIKELEDAGVFSRDETGCIFSRRMLRDEEIRSAQAAGGKKGGNPKLIGEYNRPGFIYVAERYPEGRLKIGIGLNPAKRLYKIKAQYPNSDIKLITSAFVDNMGKEEASLNRLFLSKKDGEWFDLNKGERETLLHLIDHLKVYHKVIDKVNQTPSSSSSSSKEKIYCPEEQPKNEEELLSGSAGPKKRKRGHEDEYLEPRGIIITHLNSLLGSRYNPESLTCLKLINARLSEGATTEECLAVIEIKVKQWKDDPKMSAYLRPTTLFNAEKFESYREEARRFKAQLPSEEDLSWATEKLNKMDEEVATAEEEEKQ